METAIAVTHLTRTFRVKRKAAGLRGSLRAFVRPEYAEVQAVRDISFSIERGKRVAFIGPNGAGKSTTIKMLVGILYPTSGQAQVLGLVPWRERRQLARRIGVLFGQKSQLWYHLPAGDSFDLMAQVYRLDMKPYRERLNHLVSLFEIEPLLRTPVRKLSLGQRMRCEIAASLLHRPEILLLDEPTIGLDVVVKQQLRDLILNLSRSEGVTILLASHDTGDVEALCDQAIVINEGALVYNGTLDQLKDRFISSRVVALKLGEPVDAIQLPGVKTLSQADYNLTLEVNLAQTSIESVISALLARCAILDIAVGAPSIEKIIRDIYQEKAPA